MNGKTILREYCKCKICGTRIRKIYLTDEKTIDVDPKPVPFYVSVVGNIKFVMDDGRIVYGIYEPMGNKIGYIPHTHKRKEK